MVLNLDNSSLFKYIPNVMRAAVGEPPLFDKLAPFIEVAKADVEARYVGSDTVLSEAHQELATKIIVAMAFVSAIPSIDLVLSASGFGVIRTDSLAPASKERIERLITSLSSYIDAMLVVLVDQCHNYGSWRKSYPGKDYCSTLLSDFNDIAQFRRDSSIYDTWLQLQRLAAQFERLTEESYLGKDLMAWLRNGRNDRSLDRSHEILSMVFNAELRYIAIHLRDQKFKCPDVHELWHMMRPVIARLSYFPDLHDMWLAEMGNEFELKPFKNDIKGGYFF